MLTSLTIYFYLHRTIKKIQARLFKENKFFIYAEFFFYLGFLSWARIIKMDIFQSLTNSTHFFFFFLSFETEVICISNYDACNCYAVTWWDLFTCIDQYVWFDWLHLLVHIHLLQKKNNLGIFTSVPNKTHTILDANP